MSRSTFKMKRVFIIIGLFFIGIINSPAFASNTYCVDAAAASGGTGSCWSSPFKDLSAALSAATTVGDQILVAKGTYKPTGGTRACTFLLNTNGIGVYGGYPTGGGVRDPINNPTILSGDIGTASDISDNCYHVITIGTNVRLNGVLDGVTITAGNANSANYPDYLGGGVISKDSGTLTISNVTLTSNYAWRGGGMYNSGSTPTLNSVIFSNNFATDTVSGKAGGMYNYANSSPILNNVSFIGNSSALDGGGMYNSTNSSPTLNNVIFQSNISTGSGAGIFNYNNSNMSLSNSTFSGNTAHNNAGAICNSTTSNATIVNSTFSGNTASTGSGGAIYNDGGTQSLNNSTFTNNTSGTGTALYNKNIAGLTITNSLFWGNSTGQAIVNSGSTPMISYSLVQNSNGSGGSWVSSLGVDAGHNLDSDPLLSTLGDYGGSTQTHALLPNSAAIDAGNACGSNDQRGLSRVSICDIGAFESQGFTLTKISGDTQSTAINTSFANPLVVSLSSAASEPIIGGTVTFTDLGTTAKTTLSSAQQVSLSSSNASLAAPTANGTQGNYVVQASVRGAVSPVSFSLTNTAAPTAPTAPSTLVATAISTTQIDLTWVDNSSNETGFKVESPVGTLLNTTAANATTYSHTGLTCGTTYSYSLKATNAAGDSAAITASATTSACPVVIPTAPSTLVATAISTTQINLTWVDNSSNETGFKLENPVGTLLNTTAANATTYSHTGLTCGTTYSYSLKATNLAGDSTAITASATTSACPVTIPNAPNTLVATAISTTQIDLTWVDNSSNETGFKLESPVGTLLNTAAANATTYSHTGLTCGTTYSYSLKATNAAGDSAAITASATTTACPVSIPNAPSTLTATTISTTQIDLTWVDNSSNETGFKLESPVGTLLNTTAANATTYSHTGLTCGTTYSYSLKATNLAGDSTAITASAMTSACPVVIPNYNLGVATAGTGSGVVSGTPAGSYPSGTSINLSALASVGSSFTGWSPSSCGTTFNLTANLNCIALFETLPPATYNLALNKAGTGSGIISGTTAGNYSANTAINLTAVASTGSTFKGWSPSTCATFNLIQNTTCTAIFDSDATATSYNLSIQTLGNGKGIVGGTPAGKYVQNTAVNLLAVADSSSEFVGWTPSSCATGFLLNADSTCVANFSLKTVQNFNLVLNQTGAGTGTILGTATGVYPQNTAINLVAVADSTSEFAGWNPTSCGNSFNLLADTTCTANFTQKVAASYHLSIAQAGSGSGTISGNAAGDYVSGTVISLFATADADSLLTGWSPMNCGTAFALNANTQCTAVFDKKTTTTNKPIYNLTLLASGVSNANLNATPAAPYEAGTQVKLSATAPNAQFLGWQGNGCDSSLTIDRNLICVANFQALNAGRVRFVDDTGNILAQLSEKKSASSIKVNVARVEGKTGVVSIHYQTQAGTALAGVDYQTLSGTLTWDDADNSVKTIEIPLVSNSTHYGENYFYLLVSTDNEQLKLDSPFIKLILQDVINQFACNNALQIDNTGNLQGNASCFTHRVNNIETGKANVALLSSNPVHIQSIIDMNPQYLGQYGEILMVAVYFPNSVADPIALQRRGNTWLYWDGSLEELSAITRYASLPKQITVDVYDGVLSNALGRFEVYVGYRLADGSIVFNGLNLLKIKVSAQP
ncbi:MAG: choice-of-anchor Q domain-containing protein [Thiotrichaceae bacterium]|nr:choice-of-anchor Q domain-containing protein [Thiotrichaceae bacterium]